jgi:hypothetical protein
MQNRKVEEVDMRGAGEKEQNAEIHNLLKTYGVIEWIDEGPGGRNGAMSFHLEELKTLTRDKRTMTVIISSMRPGAMTFLTQLEWRFFAPASRLAKFFRVFYVIWAEETWAVVLMPLKMWGKVNRFAAQMKMCLKEGIPMVIDGQGARRFPVGDHHTIVTLENAVGSPVYGMSGEGWKLSMDLEAEMTTEFIDKKAAELKTRRQGSGKA